MHLLIVEKLPFNRHDIPQSILRYQFKKDINIMDNIDPLAIDFLAQMLTTKEKRSTAEQLLKHNFILTTNKPHCFKKQYSNVMSHMDR